MRWENLRDFFRPTRREKCGVNEVAPRQLTPSETDWIEEILRATPGCEDVTLSDTFVVAEGPHAEGYTIVLHSARPQLAERNGTDTTGNLWIDTGDRHSVNVQLSQGDGKLQEIYVLYIDPKHPRRLFPERWTEVSRSVTGLM
jgi:hypothetical protein